MLNSTLKLLIHQNKILMEEEILRLVSESVKHISDVYGEPKKITKYGNSIILTFAKNK